MKHALTHGCSTDLRQHMKCQVPINGPCVGQAGYEVGDLHQVHADGLDYPEIEVKGLALDLIKCLTQIK